MSGDMVDVFRKIYQTNAWRGRESRSGPGSSYAATLSVRTALPQILQQLKVGSLLDVPCGEFGWMGEVMWECRERKGMEIRYTGGDIVPELVRNNVVNYPMCSFTVIDISETLLPSAEILVVRDCLVHFSYADIIKTLRNIRRSGFIYIAMTNFHRDREFIDLPTGSWRPVNFRNDPFRFPAPMLCVGEDNSGYPDKELAIWLLSDVVQVVDRLGVEGTDRRLEGCEICES